MIDDAAIAEAGRRSRGAPETAIWSAGLQQSRTMV
jgi:hypothetical protein